MTRNIAHLIITKCIWNTNLSIDIVHNKAHRNPLEANVLLGGSFSCEVLLVKKPELIRFPWEKFWPNTCFRRLTIELVNVSFLIVVSEVNDWYDAGIPERSCTYLRMPSDKATCWSWCRGWSRRRCCPGSHSQAPSSSHHFLGSTWTNKQYQS